MAHPLLEKAAQHLAQARAINDEFQGKDMPAEAAHQMEQHLGKASELRSRVTREASLSDNESWMSDPEYKHDMGAGGARSLTGIDHGDILLESERAEKQRESFYNFVRKGFAGVAPEVKADLVEDATGELLVPQDFAGTIVKDIARDAIIRNLAAVRPTSRNRVDIGALIVNKPTWGKLELGDNPADGLGAASRESIRVWNLNALVKIGVDELEDTDDNLEEIIRSELGSQFAEVEDDAFAAGVGDGSKQPFGIASDVGATLAAAAGETVTADDLKSLRYKVPEWARRNGVYLAHSTAEEKATLLKGTDGHYLWQESLREGEPPTFAGKRWYTLDGLPAMLATDDAGAGTNKSVIFGDPRRGYQIIDRRRFTVQRLTELYAEDGKIGLLFTHRVGGDVIRPKAFAAYLL